MPGSPTASTPGSAGSGGAARREFATLASLLLAASLNARIECALAAPTLRGAHVGILAVNLADDRIRYARNPDDDFVPASTFKLIVGSAALATLGPAYTFDTEVARDGSTLYLRGGGDAHLDDADLAAAADAVAATGLRSVALVGDATRYQDGRYPPGWSIDDIPYGYAAVPSALSFDENVAHVRIAPGPAIGAPVRVLVDPTSSAFAVDDRAVTGPCGSRDTTDIARPWDEPATIAIVGSYPICAKTSDDFEPALPDPPAYALDRFAAALGHDGVAVTQRSDGTTPPGARTIWLHRSAPLATLLAPFWLPSDNLVGELLLQELGVDAALPATSTRARGIAVERRWLRSIGVDPATLTIVDGSGLSEYDRVTPRALVAILEADWHAPYRSIVLDALPVAGVRGTLADTFAHGPLRGRVIAKTGTLNHAPLLAGYLEGTRGTLAFALMINDWMDTAPDADHALDRARARILAALAHIALPATHPPTTQRRSKGV